MSTSRATLIGVLWLTGITLVFLWATIGFIILSGNNGWVICGAILSWFLVIIIIIFLLNQDEDILINTIKELHEKNQKKVP